MKLVSGTQDSQFWTLPKEQSATVITAALGLVKVLAAMLAPYMPSTTRAMHGMLNAPPEWGLLGQAFLDDAGHLQKAVPPGHKVAKPVLLFSEISEDAVAQLQLQFSGTQAAQAATAAAGAGTTGGSASGGGAVGKVSSCSIRSSFWFSAQCWLYLWTNLKRDRTTRTRIEHHILWHCFVLSEGFSQQMD